MIKKTLCFSNPIYLSMRNNQLVLRLPEVEGNDDLPASFKKEAMRTIPIEDIGVVIIDHKRVTITSGALEALLENNCAFITCNQKSMPIGLMLPLEGNLLQSERYRAQMEASLPLKKQLWQQTIKQKILNQAAVMQQYTEKETKCMVAWAKDVRSGDPDNLEGRAAAYYWNNLFEDFPNFRRDREGPAPNNLLNYGYAILRAIIARSLVASGLQATIGIHHHNRYNAYCLADDIMEPYRPYVDELVLSIIKSFDNIKEITKDIKMQLLSIPMLDVTMNGKRSPLMIAAQQTTASLAKCFLGEGRKVAYPEMKIQ